MSAANPKPGDVYVHDLRAAHKPQQNVRAHIVAERNSQSQKLAQRHVNFGIRILILQRTVDVRQDAVLRTEPHRLIQRKFHKQKRWTRLLKKQFYPEPRMALGEWLAARRCATSMIDTSDGLSTDLGHICEASGVGAIVWSEKVPAVRMPAALRRLGLDPLDLALNGGEDYELLFTVPGKIAKRLPHNLGGVPITVIGEITRRKKVIVLGPDGLGTPLQPKGWDPFRKKL